MNLFASMFISNLPTLFNYLITQSYLFLDAHSFCRNETNKTSSKSQDLITHHSKSFMGANVSSSSQPMRPSFLYDDSS